ncbi:hypothetical protein HN748_03130 [Candidatus Peregrinibacteria bacterium]|jgi:hypothetical protein|nr:hypothetical protein [Candidatus Peregrinibacteria bacterium]MBT7484083.1 hypothetical protein [Candidatus Peregrinibacteria bacterium]MBT7703201.1 hypothetical protein [Candidatus Peregrinibacteria bacterium]
MNKSNYLATYHESQEAFEIFMIKKATQKHLIKQSVINGDFCSFLSAPEGELPNILSFSSVKFKLVKLITKHDQKLKTITDLTKKTNFINQAYDAEAAVIIAYAKQLVSQCRRGSVEQLRKYRYIRTEKEISAEELKAIQKLAWQHHRCNSLDLSHQKLAWDKLTPLEEKINEARQERQLAIMKKPIS